MGQRGLGLCPSGAIGIPTPKHCCARIGAGLLAVEG